MASAVAMEARGLTWTPLGCVDPVLDAVDLRIEPGERVMIAGASGAGKSTLLRALAGVLGEAEAGDLAGEVRLGSEKLRAGDGKVGLVLQDPGAAIVAGRVGRDVAFGPENLGVPRAQIHSRVADALTAVGFPYGPEHRSAHLSGGEVQRLALAGALAMHPRMLLLDEPTAMLDDDSAAQVRSAVERVVADRRVGLVVVEHRLDRWINDPADTSPGEPLIDRLIVLAGGDIIADGPPRTVLTARRADLLAAGIWLPGAPAPAPARLFTLPGPQFALRPGESAVQLRGVGLTRRLRRGLSITRGEAPAPALVGVDLDVTAGAVTVVRGRSGAGKSSLLSVAVGLERPSTGQVQAAAEFIASRGRCPADWTSRELAERAAWVPQHAPSTVAGSTVLDSLLATARVIGVPEDIAADRGEALLAALGLEGTEHRNPYTLSGGQLRRLALASALVHGPSVLALDEPTVGQDRHTWAAVAGLLRAAVTGGAAALVSTHDDALAALADATHEMSSGHLAGVRR